MKTISSAVAALSLTSTLAFAGGIDRSTMPFSILFEKGSVAQLSFSNVTPSVSGITPTPGPSLPTGNMAQSYTPVSLAFKSDLSDKLGLAVIVNSPYGADAAYTTGAYTGLEAHWKSDQIAALLKYKVTDRVSVYGGLRYVTSSATINIPSQMTSGAGTYTASAASDSQVGYVVGAAYEVPDIALRVGLSYETEITHSFPTAERFANVNSGYTMNSTTDIKLPQTLTLDFQSGVAKDTLVFGSIRWSEWSQWHVVPAYYFGATGGEVTGFDNDVVTYQLGVGRRLNENFSVFARLGYERATGGVASRLSPTDGMQSIGVGGSWTQDNIKVTGGVEYVKVGDAVDGSGTVFSGNDAVGVGVSVAFSF